MMTLGTQIQQDWDISDNVLYYYHLCATKLNKVCSLSFFFFFLVQGVKPQFLPFKALLRPVERRSVQLGLTPTADPHWLCSSVNGNKIFNSHARKCKSLLHAALSKSLQVHDCCKNTTTTTTNKSNNNQQNKKTLFFPASPLSTVTPNPLPKEKK